MSDKLREAIYKRQIAEGSLYFTILHPEFNPGSGNLALLISEIEARGLDLGEEESWEATYEAIKNRLAPFQKHIHLK